MCYRNTRDTYGVIAKLFHWVLAVFVLGMISVGVSFNYLSASNFKTQLIQVHKSLGVTILCLMILRLWWRLINPQPRLPQNTPTWERLAMHSVHWLLYLTVIAMPLSGMIMSQAAGYAVQFWWFFSIKLPWVLPSKALASDMFVAHKILAWTITTLVVIHTLAALKHHYLNKDTILKRMMPKKDDF